MEHEFWHERWGNNQIAFHEADGNELLKRHFHALDLEEGARLFLPLCGKTRDIHWLLGQGYEVAGAELSELAIQQLFRELGIKPEVNEVGELTRYSAPRIDIFVGDIFKLTADQLGEIDAVYDRAALVALPQDMRTRYGAHLPELTDHADQLLITFDYDQSMMDGPPFAVPEEEVRRLYENAFALECLETSDVEGGLKKKAPATESVWLLTR
ncbi:MAG: thiopurine S-methyltransferase [Ponticaulis sp.]|nr:thiopurine S-methyltransferase [Ponticaulis sp.]